MAFTLPTINIPSPNLNQNYGQGFHDAFFNTLDDLTGVTAAKKAARKKAENEKKKMAEQDAQNTANANALAAGQRLSLLKQSGYSSTILAPSTPTLGSTSILGV